MCRIGGDHPATHILMRGKSVVDAQASGHDSAYCEHDLLNEIAAMLSHEPMVLLIYPLPVPERGTPR